MKKAAILWGLALLVCGDAAWAKDRSGTRATPAGSPGDWINPKDYPSIALRFEMQGNTRFNLSIDASGMPTRCDIIESSGFDVLDTASCERLMAKARFQPARTASGKPVEDTFTSRIIWRIPESLSLPMVEGIGSMTLTIDRIGAITSCVMTVLYPVGDGTENNKGCPEGLRHQTPEFGMALRQNSPDDFAYAELQTATVFSPTMRQRALSTFPSGYRQLALNIYRFTVKPDGKLADCIFEEQRGDPRFAMQFCGDLNTKRYAPPASAMDKEGVATGWNIYRVLVRQP